MIFRLKRTDVLLGFFFRANHSKSSLSVLTLQALQNNVLFLCHFLPVLIDKNYVKSTFLMMINKCIDFTKNLKIYSKVMVTNT